MSELHQYKHKSLLSRKRESCCWVDKVLVDPHLVSDEKEVEPYPEQL